MQYKRTSFLDIKMILSSTKNAFLMLTPRIQLKNPVMFVTYLGAIATTLYVINEISSHSISWFDVQIAIWLWFTVVFANFAEAIAESRGKAQAASLRKTKIEAYARWVQDGIETKIPSNQLKRNDIIICETGDIIPADGEVIEGAASVDESAITGESAPVIREGGGDRSAVTAGTQVISDWLIVRITSNPGETFLDHMISLVEGAKRQKTPNELALTILLAALTIVFLLVCATLLPFSIYSVAAEGIGQVVTITVLVALFVCLAPTTIGGLLSAIGIAGMDRMIQANVIAMSGHAVEAAGDVDMLLLDKTGTITLGNRQATEFIPASDVDEIG